jgi:hypothetical protein
MASLESQNPKLQEIENQIAQAEGLEPTAPEHAISIYRTIALDGK